MGSTPRNQRTEIGLGLVSPKKKAFQLQKKGEWLEDAIASPGGSPSEL